MCLSATHDGFKNFFLHKKNRQTLTNSQTVTATLGWHQLIHGQDFVMNWSRLSHLPGFYRKKVSRPFCRFPSDSGRGIFTPTNQNACYIVWLSNQPIRCRRRHRWSRTFWSEGNIERIFREINTPTNQPRAALCCHFTQQFNWATRSTGGPMHIPLTTRNQSKGLTCVTRAPIGQECDGNRQHVPGVSGGITGGAKRRYQEPITAGVSLSAGCLLGGNCKETDRICQGG